MSLKNYNKMTKQELQQLIHQGEHQKLEFKKAADALPKSVWETYSSFANTDGGQIILGIDERKGKFIPVGVSYPEKVIKEFWNLVSNQQKVSVNILYEKDVSLFKIDEKQFILINVPRANRQERPVYLNNNVFTGTYRRNFEGDYKCNKGEVKAMLRDQSDVSVDMTVVDDVYITDMLTSTFRRYRIRFNNHKIGHVWEGLNDEEFLLKIGAARRIKNEIMPTLAGVLMFCEEHMIVTALPQYFLDYREKEHESDLRWIDRIYSNSGTWAGNIFDFYFNVTERVLESVKVPFRLEGITRIDETPVHKSIREAIANTLIHADYYGTRGVVIEKLPHQIILQNPGGFRLSVSAATDGGVSDPRNSGIFKMFALVGIGERAGSGLHAIHHVWNQFNLSAPSINEHVNPERIVFSLDWSEKVDRVNESGEVYSTYAVTKKAYSDTKGWSIDTIKNDNVTINKRQNMIISILKDQAHITVDDMAEKLNVNRRTVIRDLAKLQEHKIIKRFGGRKIGYWEVMD